MYTLMFASFKICLCTLSNLMAWIYLIIVICYTKCWPFIVHMFINLNATTQIMSFKGYTTNDGFIVYYFHSYESNNNNNLQWLYLLSFDSWNRVYVVDFTGIIKFDDHEMFGRVGKDKFATCYNVSATKVLLSEKLLI